MDEKALSRLDDEVFLALRRPQALPIVYALHLSSPQPTCWLGWHG
ncbi:hypothetical protein ACRHM7_12995 [Chromohalobacter israelensis]